MIEKQTMGMIVVLSIDAKSKKVERTVFLHTKTEYFLQANTIFLLGCA